MTTATSTPPLTSRVVLLRTVSGKKCRLTPPLDVRHILQVAIASFGFDEASVKIVIANQLIAIGREAHLAHAPASDTATRFVSVRRCLNMDILELYNWVLSTFCRVPSAGLLSRIDFERDSTPFEILVFGKVICSAFALRRDNDNDEERTAVAKVGHNVDLVDAPAATKGASSTGDGGGDTDARVRSTTHATMEQTTPPFALLPYPHSPIGLQRLLQLTVQFETSRAPDRTHILFTHMTAHPTMHLITTRVRADPSTLEPIMRHIRQVKPQLFDWISTHPELFLTLLGHRDGPWGDGLHEIASSIIQQLPLDILRNPRGFFVELRKNRLTQTVHIEYFYHPRPDADQQDGGATINDNDGDEADAHDDRDDINDDADDDDEDDETVVQEGIEGLDELEPLGEVMYMFNTGDIQLVTVANGSEAGSDASGAMEESERSASGQATTTPQPRTPRQRGSHDTTSPQPDLRLTTPAAQPSRDCASEDRKGSQNTSAARPAMTHMSTTVASALSAAGKCSDASTASQAMSSVGATAAASPKRCDMPWKTNTVSTASVLPVGSGASSYAQHAMGREERGGADGDDSTTALLRRRTAVVAERLKAVQSVRDCDPRVLRSVHALVQALSALFLQLLQRHLSAASWPSDTEAAFVDMLQLAHEHLARSEAFYLAVSVAHDDADDEVVFFDTTHVAETTATALACEAALARLFFLYVAHLMRQATRGADTTTRAETDNLTSHYGNGQSPLSSSRPRVGALRQLPALSSPLRDPVLRWIGPDGPRRLLRELLQLCSAPEGGSVLWYSQYCDTQDIAHTVSYILRAGVVARRLDIHPSQECLNKVCLCEDDKQQQSGGPLERCLQRLRGCAQAGVGVPTVLATEWGAWTHIIYKCKVKPIEPLLPVPFVSSAPLYVVDTTEAVAPWRTAGDRGAAMAWQAWSDTPRGVGRFFAGLFDEQHVLCLDKWPTVSATTPWAIVLAHEAEEEANAEPVVRFDTPDGLLPQWLPSAWQAHTTTPQPNLPRRVLIAHLAHDTGAEEAAVDASSRRASGRRWSNRSDSLPGASPSLAAAARTPTAPQHRSLPRDEHGAEERSQGSGGVGDTNAALCIVDARVMQYAPHFTGATLLRSVALTGDGAAAFYADLYTALCERPAMPLAAAVRETVLHSVRRHRAPWLAIEFTLLNYGGVLPELAALFAASASGAPATASSRPQSYLTTHAVDDLYEMMLTHLLQTRPTGTVAVVDNLIAYVEQHKDVLAAKASAGQRSRGDHHHHNITSDRTGVVAPATGDLQPLTPQDAGSNGGVGAAVTQTNDTKADVLPSSRPTPGNPPRAGDDAKGDDKAAAPS